MWISEPMPVITRIITDDSGSSRSVKAAVKSPDVIQVNAWLAIARDSCGRPTSCHTAASDTTNDPTIAPHATAPAAALLTRRPKLAVSRKPRNGSRGMRISMRLGPQRHQDTKTNTKKNDLLCVLVSSWSRSPSPFQARERIGVERFPVAEQADHDRQADGRLGRRDRHDEEHD